MEKQKYELLLEEEQGIDFRKWFGIFLRSWPLFLVCLLVALTIAFIAYSLSTPVYEVHANLLVNEEKDPLDKAALFEGAIYFNQYQLENEKGILQSKGVTSRAIENLDFEVSYYRRELFREYELYMNSPFSIHMDTSQLQPAGILFSLEFLDDTTFVISNNSEEVGLYSYPDKKIVKQIALFEYVDTLGFGQLAGNKYSRFVVMPGKGYSSEGQAGKRYQFKFNTYQGLIRKYRNFRVENQRNSSILNLSVRHGNAAKATAFLNALATEYLRKGVERDNEIARATIRFIDAQLSEIVDSLQVSGTELQDFKSSNKVLDIGFQAEQEYTKLEAYEAEKARLLVQRRYFNYLLETLRSKSEVSDLIAPSSMEINDPVLNSLIIELADLYTERAEMSFNSIRENPYLRTLELRIEETRRKLMDAANNVLQTIEIALEEKEQQIVTAEQKLNRLPRDQQTLLNIERRFKLNDELYTYLLTRRSEMEIFQASNLPANEVLEWAAVEDAVKVAPNLKISMLTALLLGLLLPGILLYLRESLNYKIRNKDDIRRITDVPLLGHIIDSKSKEFPAVLSEPNSLLTESYRTLRTNLQFVINENESNTILVSSAVKGEGKSFTALNLAAVYAFYGKKTLLIDFDMRKSGLGRNLGIMDEKGLSNYLSRNADLDEVIISHKQLNFDLIYSGPFPPNPSELVASERTPLMLDELKKRYDIIIIDSPPIGVVSDAVFLYSLIDITLLVARYNYTHTDVFANVLENITNQGGNRINIVLNDVNPSRSGYGYYYSYGPDRTRSQRS